MTTFFQFVDDSFPEIGTHAKGESFDKIEVHMSSKAHLAFENSNHYAHLTKTSWYALLHLNHNYGRMNGVDFHCNAYLQAVLYDKYLGKSCYDIPHPKIHIRIT